RDEQDAFALRSHQRAVAAIDSDRFAGEITPIVYEVVEPGLLREARPADREARPADRKARPTQAIRRVTHAQDEGPRRDTSIEALAKLRPAFHATGTVTAGNSSQTSDGAAAVIVTSADRAKAAGLTPMARFVTFATAGVEPERFGIGPVPAIQKALKLAGLTLDQID